MRRLHVKSFHFQVKFLTLFGDIFTRLVTTSFQNTTTQHDAGFKSSSSFARTSIVRSKCQRIDHTTTVSQIAWNCHKIKEEAHERRVRDETIISRGGRRTNGLAPKNCALPCQSPPLTCCSNSLAIVWCYMQCNTRTKATQTKFWDFFIWANQMSSKNEMSKKSSWVFFSKMHEMLKIFDIRTYKKKLSQNVSGWSLLWYFSYFYMSCWH